jgi:hypothetical protein
MHGSGTQGMCKKKRGNFKYYSTFVRGMQAIFSTLLHIVFVYATLRSKGLLL